MKKIIFGVFAHPDDEAFGPVGTLLLEAKSGTELHLICLTAGENGTNPDTHSDLGEVRLGEWRAAARLIGATSTHHLGYSDGHLDNVAMIEIAQKVESIVKEAVSDEVTEVEFMSLDPNGYTGHIDHIVASRAVSHVFHRLKATDNRFVKIRFACLAEEQHPVVRTDWIYMNAGHPADEIDETVDARQFQPEILEIMRCHNSQRADYEAVVKIQGDNLGLDHFIVSS